MKRSPQEIVFRLRQEAANLWLGFGPATNPPRPVSLPLPSAETIATRLRGTEYARILIDAADGALRREFQLLGYTLKTEAEINWRRDYISERESGTGYFRGIPYLDSSRVGDHKIIWELNRHQHLAALAQAHLLTGNEAYLEDLWRQLESWLDQNPFCRGMNWTSALEVAFRALSWLWIEHLAGTRMPESLHRRWLASFYQHGQHLEYNLSIYFSPNTHLQGEALALHALGLLFGNTRWRRIGAEVLAEIIETHVRPDGGHFEQSSYYHVYATDMFLFHALLREKDEPVSDVYRERLRKMAGYLWALCASGDIPLLGDDDGGRLFNPYGVRREFGRATLATCSVFLRDTPCHGDPRDQEPQALWWLRANIETEPGPKGPVLQSTLFPDTGLAVLADGEITLHADTRAFGFGGAGHSHAHALHFTLKRGATDVLIDPGTYTYVADPALRTLFRGTAMHNTVRIDGLDQADQAGPFRWSNLPQTSVLEWSPGIEANAPWSLHAVCRYRSIEHHRQMRWSGGVLFVLDTFQGDGTHKLEQFWHPGDTVRKLSDSVFELPASVTMCVPEGSSAHLEEGGDFGWYSPAPGSKLSRPVIRIDRETSFPCHMAAAFQFSHQGTPLPLEIIQEPEGVRLECGSAHVVFR